LTQILTRVESTNLTLSLSAGTSEGAVANYIQSWLSHRKIVSHHYESLLGPPSVVGVVRGAGYGKSLTITGYVDTVSSAAYASDPVSGGLSTRNPREIIYGRGSLNTETRVAAGMATLVHALLSKTKLKDDVTFATVAGEENTSHGASKIVEAGWRADGALITGPTKLGLVTYPKGSCWVGVEILGWRLMGVCRRNVLMLNSMLAYFSKF
jgi:acetylornithine deacetylase/succinyl-diaminopimelate desuccinylase-like protein